MKKYEVKYTDRKCPGMTFMVVARSTAMGDLRTWLKRNGYVQTGIKQLVWGK